MKTLHFFFLISLSLLFSCSASQKTADGSQDDGLIEAIILQMNDVYEISPLEGGKAGGLARVASLRKQLMEENSNTFTVLAGDFLNPSLYGTLEHNNEKVKGKQIVEVMNAMGVDLVTFGNHEFDLKEAELQKRLDESKFNWLASNVYHKTDGQKKAFYRAGNPCPKTLMWEITDTDGTKIKIGFFSATIDSNPKEYVFYEDHTEAVKKILPELKKNTDIQIGITHLNIAQDLELAKQIDGVPLFIGGHDHDHMIRKSNNTTVAKADANAKSVYVHRIKYDTKKKAAKLQSELIFINSEIETDPEVDALVKKWEGILNASINDITPNPHRVVYNAKDPLDGLEKSIRNFQTNLGLIIAQSMIKASKNAVDGAIVNGGSVRIDDQLQGKITALDVFRVLPFGGDMVEIELTGTLLKKILDTGRANRSSGGYLQRARIDWNENKKSWMIGKTPLVESQNYRIAITSFLLTGLEKDMGFLTEDNPGILSISKPKKEDTTDIRRDIRLVVIDYMETLQP